MEVPVFIAMLVLWLFSDRRDDVIRLVFLLLFELHYFHRSFIFPRQLRGHSRMPWTIVLMGEYHWLTCQQTGSNHLTLCHLLRWLHGITDSMEMDLSKFQERVRTACCSPWGRKELGTT